MVTERDLTLDDETTMQYPDDILQNCTCETYIILLTNVTLINLIKKLKAYLTRTGGKTTDEKKLILTCDVLIFL